MNPKCLLIVGLMLFTLSTARPKNKNLNLATESVEEAKIREKRKYEIPLLRQLKESGVGVKRELPLERPEASEIIEQEAEEAKAAKATEAIGGKENVKDEPEIPPEGGQRVKKQSPNNVCIKIGGCGKTVCGPVVSARGPVVSDMRAVMQGGKPVISLGDFHPGPFNEMSDASSRIDRVTPVQGRTVDTIVAPIALGTLGYGTPAAYSAPSPAVDLGHSFFKPPSVPAVPALAVITAPHPTSHPLVHPWLVPHLVPHIMPSLMSNLGSFFAPHRLEPARFPETIPTDFKQPAPAFPVPSYGSFGGDNTLLCQPYRSQRLDGPYDYIYKPDLGIDKSINVTEGSKKSQTGMDGEEDRKIHEHLRKVNEIKEEISQLNRAAQRIVDQQERLTAMQQKQLWGGPGQSSAQPSDQMTSPYMGSGYYAHPTVPWGYSRSNILSYPRSQDDIEFFINLMRAGKKIGLLSDVVQPNVLSTIGEALKGVQDGAKIQKEASNGTAQPEDIKTGKPEKKSNK